uniref:Phosphoinositide 3-kinase regulatory subunit 6 n=1 Tax=Heterorhabditis bacteriophora TaxID=37862 RepID=A0A1I7X7B3_HETBA
MRYLVNMDKPCPFWVDDRQCISKQCGISFCDDEVPAGLRKPAVVVNRLFLKYNIQVYVWRKEFFTASSLDFTQLLQFLLLHTITNLVSSISKLLISFMFRFLHKNITNSTYMNCVFSPCWLWSRVMVSQYENVRRSIWNKMEFIFSFKMYLESNHVIVLAVCVKEDIETRQAIDELLDIIRQFPDQFDEHELFTVNTYENDFILSFTQYMHSISQYVIICWMHSYGKMSWKQCTADRWKLTKYVDLRSKQNRTIVSLFFIVYSFLCYLYGKTVKISIQWTVLIFTHEITSDELSVVVQRARRLLVVYSGNHVLEQIPLHHPQPIVVFRDCAIHITLILPTQQEIKFRIRLANVAERSALCAVLSDYITVHDYYATHSGQSQSSLLSNDSNESQIVFSQTLSGNSLPSPYYDSPRGSQQLDQRQRCSQMKGSQDLFIRNSQEMSHQLSQTCYSSPSIYQNQGLSQSYTQACVGYMDDISANYPVRNDLLPTCVSNRQVSAGITFSTSTQKIVRHDRETQTDHYDLSISPDKLCITIDYLLRQPEFRALVNVIKNLIPSTTTTTTTTTATTADMTEVPFTLTSIGLDNTPCKPDQLSLFVFLSLLLSIISSLFFQDLSFLSNDSASLCGGSGNRYLLALERNSIHP